MDPLVSDRSVGDELRWIDGELARVDRARAWLVNRRLELLAALASQAEAVAPSTPDLSADRIPQPVTSEKKPAELTGRAVARLLLAAGAVLVVIAAAAFTVASWSSIGPLGRVSVLLGVTAVVLIVPVPLTRRGMVATAESVAAVGLALTIADAYLAWRLLDLGRSTILLAIATATALLAVAWAAYARATRLRGASLGALGMAQIPGLYLTAALARAVEFPVLAPVAFSLMAVAAADMTYAAFRREYRTEAAVASALGMTTWLAGLALAALHAVPVHELSIACWLAATFVAAGIVGIVVWPKAEVWPSSVAPVSVASGFVLAGVALPVAVSLPAGWQVVVFAAASAGVAWAATALSRKTKVRTDDGAPAGDLRTRLDLAAAGAAVALGMTGLRVLPRVFIPAGSGWPTLIVLILLGSACWLAPIRQRTGAKCAAILIGGLAVASTPTALGATGWLRLAILTVGSAAFAIGAALRRHDAGRAESATAVAVATALGMTAALWSLAGTEMPLTAMTVTALTATALTATAMTVAELAGLAVVFGVAAALARNNVTAAVATAAALIATTGLTVAASSGLPFAVLATAVIAVAVATLLRRIRPVHALVLDLAAGPVVVLAAILTAGRADTIAIVTVSAAALASAASWVRSGLRRGIALGATGCAVVAAVASQWRPLTQAWSAASLPWHGHPLLGPGAVVGLPFAVGVLAVGFAAVATAAGALRGSGRGSLDAVAIALPVVAGPALLAGGVGYWVGLACLIALALGLTGWAAFGGNLAPVGGAVVATSLAMTWALAAPLPTLIALGCLAAAYLASARWSSPPVARSATAGLSVAAVAAFAAAAVLAAGRPGWVAGLAILAVGTAAVVAAALVCTARRADTAPVVRASGWFTMAVGFVVFESVWCVWLDALGVRAIEAYTMPVAIIAIASGYFISRGHPAGRLPSWLVYGPGLALLLVPSLIATWQGHGWLRPTVLGVGAAAVTLAGARFKLQAPVLIGAVVAVADAGDQLAPTVRRLAEVMPGWVPFAVIGAALLWTGATYEARLRNLATIRHALADLR